jgi:hypothetical protein
MVLPADLETKGPSRSNMVRDGLGHEWRLHFGAAARRGLRSRPISPSRQGPKRTVAATGIPAKVVRTGSGTNGDYILRR